MHTYEDIISLDNLLEAWREFLNGKRARLDVQEYSLRLMDNIISLQRELANKTYTHGDYHAFNISDPKPRNIHKATVQDRVLHRALYRKLYPFFSRIFVADSFSCQEGKGMHRAIRRFASFGYKVSRNSTRTCWVLKCDIKKFFANVDHSILESIVHSYIPDKNTRALLHKIIASFHSKQYRIGLPLGNVTSQLFVNLYLNELDYFVKHTLRAKYYIRYCDDFVLLSENKTWLEQCMPRISKFLSEKLKLELHPDKVFIRTLSSGVDFLGWIHFPHHRIPRTSTKRRMFKRVKISPTVETVNSYLGLLQHGTTEQLKRAVLKEYYLNQNVL